jgi:hypothetical protein
LHLEKNEKSGEKFFCLSMKRKRDFGMYHWELILDYLDPLILVKLATVCKLFSIRANENKLRCKDECKSEIDEMSRELELDPDISESESTFYCSIYKNNTHKILVKKSNEKSGEKFFIYYLL